MLKTKRTKKPFMVFMAAVLIAITSISGQNPLNGERSEVYADPGSNPYGIVYSGGQELGTNNNVQINPGLISSLMPVIEKDDDISLSFSDSNLWQEGYAYASATSCVKVKYLRIWKDNPINSSSNLFYTVSNQKYAVRVAINNVVPDGIDLSGDNDGALTVGVTLDDNMEVYKVYKGAILAGYSIFSDSGCQNLAFSNSNYLAPYKGNIFIETQQKLFRKDDSENVYAYDGMHYGITDIDNAQSFKILNSDNALTSSTMYAKSAESLQSSDPSNPYKNMFVASGNYIYSEHGTDVYDKVDIPEDADIFVKLTLDTQRDGLRLVYGFASAAGSNLAYYARLFNVKYLAESHGSITGKKSERVIPGDNPSGSTAQPDTGYNIAKWVADVDVTLTNGDTIPAGSPITDAQIKQVVVDQDITFTVSFEMEPVVVPDTGASTQIVDISAMTATSVFGVFILASFIFIFHRLTRKK